MLLCPHGLSMNRYNVIPQLRHLVAGEIKRRDGFIPPCLLAAAISYGQGLASQGLQGVSRFRQPHKVDEFTAIAKGIISPGP